jgi:hypothetical protein
MSRLKYNVIKKILQWNGVVSENSRVFLWSLSESYSGARVTSGKLWSLFLLPEWNYGLSRVPVCFFQSFTLVSEKKLENYGRCFPGVPRNLTAVVISIICYSHTLISNDLFPSFFHVTMSWNEWVC